jgi:hypothetical protein
MSSHHQLERRDSSGKDDSFDVAQTTHPDKWMIVNDGSTKHASDH